MQVTLLASQDETAQTINFLGNLSSFVRPNVILNTKIDTNQNIYWFHNHNNYKILVIKIMIALLLRFESVIPENHIINQMNDFLVLNK
jgi:hypothetical protein